MKAAALLLALASVASADPIAVTVKPASTTWQANKPVEVSLSVANTSKTKQSIKVWTCSWDQNWKSSDPELAWNGIPCDENGESTEVLAPGATRTWKLPMFPIATAKPGKHELRMGFVSTGAATRWSKPVSITVAK